MTTNGQSPAVSVVVPCYNGGRFIDQLMDTLAAQTFRDFEVIIVDDGSNDDETRKRLAALDPAVRVIRQDNQGCGAARNTGYAAARAELVFQIDCDDTIGSTLIEQAIARMKTADNEVAVVCCYLRLGGPQGEVIPRGLDPFQLLFSNTLSPCFLIRKSAWAKIGGYDESMRDGYEDWEFALKLAHAGYRGIAIPEPLYVYRVTAEGLLFGRSSILHGAIWRYIRRKHHKLYRLPAILKLWCQMREQTQFSLLKGLAMLGFAELTSDSYQSGVIARRRRARFFGSGAPAAR